MISIAGKAGAGLASGLVTRPDLYEPSFAPRFLYEFECLCRDGSVRWRDSFANLVTTGGKNDLLDKYFAGSGYTAAWKLGLKGAGAAAVGDTLASHAGWAEVTPYAGNRPALTWNAASAGSKVANAVSFAITGTATVAGAFVTDQVSGTTGILYSAGDFAASRSVLSGDTLNVTLTASV
jgi:hypothetical protein